MVSTKTDNAARTCDHQVSAVPDGRGRDVEKPRRQLMAVRDFADPAPQTTRAPGERSNRVFNWSIGAGLVVLVVLLAAVMVNAGMNIEILP